MLKKFSGIILSSLFLSSCAQQGTISGGLPWWGWLLLLVAVILLIILLIWAFSSREGSPTMQADKEMPDEAPESMIKDDLTLIEGIGPKIHFVLMARGINTFMQLAQMEPHEIKVIMDEHGIHLAQPDTWPEQARLAHEGRFDELQVYKEKLKGGRES